MEQTRDEVVRILHDRGPSSVAEIADGIGVSPGSVRRHMDIMIAAGLVEMRLERQARGRPVTRYSLSEAGEERSAAAHYAKLLDRLYPALAGLSADEVSGQDGSTVLQRVFNGVAEEIARSYAPRISARGLDDRVVQVADVLRDEGILNDVVEEDGAFRLRNIGCPYRSTAQVTHAACAADRRTIELLLGAPVEQVATIVEGSPICEYLVARADDVAQVADDARQPVEQMQQGADVPRHAHTQPLTLRN